MIEELRDLLDRYDTIFLVCDPKSEDWASRFMRSKSLYHTQKRILFLVTGDVENQGKFCKTVSKEKAARLEALYRTYEFSDRFQLLSEESCLGGIRNYVEAGILTEEEVFEALLYR